MTNGGKGMKKETLEEGIEGWCLGKYKTFWSVP